MDVNGNGDGWNNVRPFGDNGNGAYPANPNLEQYYGYGGAWGYVYFNGVFGGTNTVRSVDLYYLHGRWWHPDMGLFLSPNEKGDYLYGGDRQDPVNFGWALPDNQLGFQGQNQQDQVLLAYGIKLVDGKCGSPCTFSAYEKWLTVDTVMQYANFLGGAGAFLNNVALNEFIRDYVTREEAGNSPVPLADASFIYSEGTGRIYIQPNTYEGYLSVNPYELEAVRIPLLSDLFDPMPHFILSGPIRAEDVFPNNTDAFPNGNAFNQFIPAHEMTHALQWGSPNIYNGFLNRFFPENLLGRRTNDRNDPISARNRERVNAWLREVVNVERQASEIMADVVASCLYAPALLADDYRSWVQQTFPLTAPGAAGCH